MTIAEGLALTVGLKAATPVVTAAVQQAIEVLKNTTASISERAARELRLGYSDFLVASYNRCQQVRTVVTGDQPVPLLDVYVPLSLKSDGMRIDDIDLSGSLEQIRRLVISGTGGAGKSMLMKYLTVSRFENSKGKIPLFVELRSINNLTTKDLLQYCFQSCSTAKQKVTFSSFEKVFLAGGFILILDGFDEIDNEHRDEIERQILSLGRRYPDAIIIVSSRNDPRFKSWQDYTTYEICELNQKQVKDLINKVKYDPGIKKRFLKDLPSLWETHQSFLSVPLLSIIMLLTFGKFAEISPKATLFYKLAFQTLFREHDANKEQFTRPIYSGLDLDDFEKSFSAFCALGYVESKYSYTTSEAKQFAKNAMKYARLSFKEIDFINDLIQNVCMLQQEGTELTFVHRSFQEYFTAIFLVGYHEKNTYELINEVASRYNDKTLEMFRELDLNKFEIEWLLPTLKRFIDDLSLKLADNQAWSAISWILRGVIFSEESGIDGFYLASTELNASLRHISLMYPQFGQILSTAAIITALQDYDSESDAFKKLLRGAKKSRPAKPKVASLDRGEIRLMFDERSEEWLASLPVLDVMRAMLLALEELYEAVLAERSSQDGLIRL